MATYTVWYENLAFDGTNEKFLKNLVGATKQNAIHQTMELQDTFSCDVFFEDDETGEKFTVAYDEVVPYTITVAA